MYCNIYGTTPSRSLGMMLKFKFTMLVESNEELAFLDTLLKRNDGKISALVYRKPTHADQYLHYSTQNQKIARKVLFPSRLIEHIPLSQIKVTYTKKTLKYSNC